MKNEFINNYPDNSSKNKHKDNTYKNQDNNIPKTNKNNKINTSKSNISKEKEQSKYHLDKLIFENKMLQKKKNNKYTYLNNNIYLNNPPNFRLLAKQFPNFAKYVYENKYGGCSIKWSDKNALKELNKCLLKKDFAIDYWEIPDGFLIPTITSRLNYICWIKSLLDDILYKEKSAEIVFDDPLFDNNNKIPQQKFLNKVIKGVKKNTGNNFDSFLNLKEDQEEKIIVTGLDIGTGANCIYPLLGYGMYKWHFKASEINPESIESANNIINRNYLESFIRVEKQNNENIIFYSVVKPHEIFYFCMCNPPYFDYSEEKSDNPHTVINKYYLNLFIY